MKSQSPQAVHELLCWLVPQLDKFPRNRRFTLGERVAERTRITNNRSLRSGETGATRGGKPSPRGLPAPVADLLRAQGHSAETF